MDRGGRQRWDHRFLDATTPGSAAAVLGQNLHLLPETGTALELACGLGANSLLLARHGLSVEAWDYSAVALARLQAFSRRESVNLSTRLVDLERPLAWSRRYQVIVVAHYLQRALCPQIVAALEPGGLVFYQTFTRSKRAGIGPDNASYLLATNELLQLFAGLELVYYREDGRNGDRNRGERDRAQYIGKKPELDPGLKGSRLR